MSFFSKTDFFLKKFLFFSLIIFSFKAFSSDVRVFSDIKSAYYSSAYPAAIEYAVIMEEEYPRSVLLAKALSLKGRSYFKLSRYEEAAAALQKACSSASSDKELLASSFYWLGKSYASSNKDALALNAFYTSCSHCDIKEKASFNEYYYLSLMNAAAVFYKIKDYKNACKILESCITFGNEYSTEDFNSIALMLFDSYLNDRKYERLLKVYSKADFSKLDSLTYASLALDAGSAYENLKEYKKAYAEYIKVLSGSDSFMASLALQKAYSLASSHRKEVGEDPALVLENAKNNLKEFDFLLAEFWTRFAIDAFEDKNYSKCRLYLDNAEEADIAKNYTALIGLYRASLDPSNALKILSDYEKKSSLSSDSEYYFSYRLLYAKTFAFENNWDNALLNAEEAYLKKVNQSSLYLYSLCLYKKGEYKKAQSILEGKNLESHELNILYAQILARNGFTKKAIALYKEHKDYLNDQALVDYSKVLFLEGSLSLSLNAALSSSLPESDYMAGLAAFNKKDWKSAEKYFTKYLSSKNKNMISHAIFYNAYAQYKTGQSLSSYKALSSFVQKYTSHPLTWNACVVGARAALNNSDYNAAASFAQKAVAVSHSNEEKETAVLLYSSIYSDSQETEKAIEVLAPYIKEKSDFAVRCRFESARLYARLDNVNKSDELYKDIQNNFSSSVLADEASFRRGELFYTRGQYPLAVSRFTEYQKKFPSGNFIDASYFFIADSYAKNNQTNRAVNQYKLLKEAFSDSSYIYSAQKNLAELYRKQGLYEQALLEARSIVQNFPVEAKADGINDEIDQLKKLLSGQSEKLVQLKDSYEDAGFSSTEKGRIIGTELCELLWEDSSSQTEAAILAEELFAIQSKKEFEKKEASYAARTALIAAQYNRAKGDAKISADYYLKAANYAVALSNHKLAQRVLYGAVEAFDFSGNTGDAKLTASKLHELYADSEYDKRSQKLIANYGD